MSVLAHILACAAALLLTVPPSACAVFRGQAQETPAPATCCEQQGEDGPSDQPGPVTPATKCCCAQDVAPLAGPQKIAASAPSLPIPSPVLPAAPVPALQADHFLHDPGPPIRVLQCVWRC